MVRIFLLSILAISCFSCSVGKKSMGQVGIRQVEGYTFKKAIPALDNLEYKVIDNPDEFHKLFTGDAIGMANPNFRGQMVIAIIKGVDKVNAAYNFTKAEVNGKTMRIFFTDSPTQNGIDNRIALATVPRVAGLTKFDFYKRDALVASVTF